MHLRRAGERLAAGGRTPPEQPDVEQRGALERDEPQRLEGFLVHERQRAGVALAATEDVGEPTVEAPQRHLVDGDAAATLLAGLAGRRDQLRRWPRMRMPAVVMIACAATIAGLLVSAVVWGVPSGAAGGVELAFFIIACLVTIHQLVINVLPVSSESDYGEPGITEAGVAYGVSPMIGGFNRIIVHLRPGRSRKRGG